jgi:hypothetical protein
VGIAPISTSINITIKAIPSIPYSLITSPSGDQVDDQNDQCYDQNNVNQAACNVEGEEAQKPENEENYKDCPKHSHSFRCCGRMSIANELMRPQDLNLVN